MEELLSTLKQLIVPVVLACFGGLAGYILKSQESRSFRQLLADMVVSAFAGMLAFYILDNYDISASWKAACIAMSGCVAREAVLIVSKRFIAFVERGSANGNKKGGEKG